MLHRIEKLPLLSDTSGMIIAITSGGPHERAAQFYFYSDPFATAQWTSRLDHGRERSSVTATQACLELGGDQGGDDQTVAQGGQKHRWWTWLALACGGVCALVGLDERQDARFAADGAPLGGERGGAVGRFLAKMLPTPSAPNQVIINLTINPIRGGALLTMCASTQPRRHFFGQGQIDDLRLAASKMTGAKRRALMAEMTLKYCGGSARLAETVFGWGRKAVEVGLAEKRTGLICFGAQSAYCGRQRWEETQPEAATVLSRLAEAHAQQDPTFHTGLAYTRLTAKAAREALRGQGKARGPTALAQHHGGGIEPHGLSAAQSSQGQAAKEAQANRCPLRQHQKKRPAGAGGRQRQPPKHGLQSGGGDRGVLPWGADAGRKQSLRSRFWVPRELPPLWNC
jgi:hypothetical protein